MSGEHVRAAKSRPGRPAVRRLLTELGLVVLALGALVPVTRQALWPDEGEAEAPRAKTVISRDMLQRVNTTNTCRRGQVALTFDDGPDLYTPQVLQVLRAYKVRATFYVMGAKVARRPDLVRAEVGDGHLVENHSWDHPHLADLDRAQVHRELADTQRAIARAGAPRPTLFRPPFGNTNARVDNEAHALGLRVVRWSVDTNDWHGRAPADIAASVLDQVVPGAVVLMHDGLPSSAATVQALPAIINGLRARGFCTALGTE